MRDHYGDDRKQTPPGSKRFIFFISLLSLAALAVFVRYAAIMLNPPDTARINPRQNFVERGPIMDRNGRILALQTMLGNISLWKPGMGDPEILALELEPILGLGAGEIRGMIDSSYSDFMYLKRRADQSTLKAVESAKAGGALKGVGIEPIVGRIYPEKRLASQIIGFVGDDSHGLAGLEYAFERELAPDDGSSSGSQLILTIDANVQHILEEIAAKVLKENEAEAVMLMAMDPRSGDILGSASMPDFDPNDIRSSAEEERMNRPAVWAYEPGSVFKIFSLSALLDSGAIRGNTIFNCSGSYERVTNLGERVTINCLGSHGPVSAREIIIYSCNAGAAYAADRLDSRSFYNSLLNLGFGARTGTGVPGETAGFLRSSERWSDRSKPTIAMGQEIAVSAFQMIQAASAIANDGVLIPPRLVSRIVSNNGQTVRNYEAGQPVRILRAETARTMRNYMTDVTSNIGTGWRASIEDLSLAVKTGTAQLIDPATGAYSSTDFIASCMALLPADSPSLVLYLVIIKPKGDSYLGGRIAAPPIREAAEALVNYLGIPRGRNPQVIHPGSIILDQTGDLELGDTIPDFSGYSKRQLLPLLLREDVHIEISGDGWVKRQNPPPGTPFTAGQTIILELE